MAVAGDDVGGSSGSLRSAPEVEQIGEAALAALNDVGGVEASSGRAAVEAIRRGVALLRGRDLTETERAARDAWNRARQFIRERLDQEADQAAEGTGPQHSDRVGTGWFDP